MASNRIVGVEGRRVYIETIYNHPIVQKLKEEIGVTWDKERRQWWCSSSKKDAVEALFKREGAGFDIRDPKDRAVRADQLKEEGRDKEAEAVEKFQEDPHDVRVLAKAKYKGKTYYVRAFSKDGRKARLVTLDQKIDFWAFVRENDEGKEVAEIVKTYQPRQVWDGRRYSGRTRTVYTTLGSIKDFIEKQNDPNRVQRVQCPECDAWHDADQPCHECGGC